jgi:hypothetical protein
MAESPVGNAVLLYRPGVGERWIEARSIGQVLSLLGKVAGEVVVILNGDSGRPAKELLSEWSERFDVPVTSDITTNRVEAPWHTLASAHELLALDLACTEAVMIAQPLVVGAVDPAGWPNYDPESLPGFLASWLQNAGVSGTSGSLAAVSTSLVSAIVSESRARAATELDHLTGAALESSKASDADHAQLTVIQLVSLRQRQRRAEAVYAGSGSIEPGISDLLGRVGEDIDALSNLVVTQQLILLTRLDQVRQSSAERANRWLSIVAAVFIPANLVFAFLGISNSPASIAGVSIASMWGQLAVLAIAVVLAFAFYIVLRRLLNTEGND